MSASRPFAQSKDDPHSLELERPSAAKAAARRADLKGFGARAQGLEKFRAQGLEAFGSRT